MSGQSRLALATGQLRRRRDRIGDYLDVWGDLRIADIGAEGTRRLIEFDLEAPGFDLPVEVNARYREYYRLLSAGDWLLAKYHYEYVDVVRGRRLAYHLHDIGARTLVPHAHCERARDLTDDEGTHHLRAVELDLREAHEQFMRLYAAGREPDCDAFFPLAVPRTVEKAIREELAIYAGDEAAQRVEDGRIVIEVIPGRHHRSMAGALREKIGRTPADESWEALRQAAWETPDADRGA